MLLIEAYFVPSSCHCAGKEVESADKSKHVYMNAVTVEYSCSTANSSVYYTTDGSKPDETSLVYSVPIKWVQAGETTFTAIANAPGYHRSRLLTSLVEVQAPNYDTHPIAQQPLSAMAPAVTVSALEVKRSGNGQSNGQIVRGKCAVLTNPAAHFSVVTAAASSSTSSSSNSSSSSSSAGSSSAALSDIKQLAVQFEPRRPKIVLLKGETYTEAGKRMKLQELEAQWQLTEQFGCQVSYILNILNTIIRHRRAVCFRLR
jgi:Chitobiase/beta-hexosaminidase C-terminal domain